MAQEGGPGEAQRGQDSQMAVACVLPPGAAGLGPSPRQGRLTVWVWDSGSERGCLEYQSHLKQLCSMSESG